MINSHLKALAERLLPHCVVARLDPVREIIESEARQVAMRVKDGEVVLDAGAGETRHKRYFARGYYVALDAGCGNPAWDYSRLDVRGELQAVPLRSSSVDCILCMVVLEHVSNPREVLLELARVLKCGGTLSMVVPFLWEEHQVPNDYFRFTRYGIGSLLQSSSFRIDSLNPMGGFFWLCARRSINLLTFFQSGWRWIFFAFMAPFFGLLFPLILFSLDRLDRDKIFSLGFQIRATKIGHQANDTARSCANACSL